MLFTHVDLIERLLDYNRKFCLHLWLFFFFHSWNQWIEFQSIGQICMIVALERKQNMGLQTPARPRDRWEIRMIVILLLFCFCLWIAICYCCAMVLLGEWKSEDRLYLYIDGLGAHTHTHIHTNPTKIHHASYQT